MRPISPGALGVCKERHLVDALRNRNVEALGLAFARFHDPLLRIIQKRMDGRLRRRIDEDDVLQESYLHAERRLDHFADVWSQTAGSLGRPPNMDRTPDREMTSDSDSTVFLWLRLVVRQTLIDLYRHHLATHKRDLHREVATDHVRILIGTNARLVGRSPSDSDSVSGRAMRDELAVVLRSAVTRLSERDQRVIALRHDEGHSNAHIATLLGISEKAASIRYARALARLRRMMG